MWIVVAEGRRDDDFGPVQLDHALHAFLDVSCVGDPFLLEDFYTRHFLDVGRASSVGLVVAVVIPGPDIDEADGEHVAAITLADGRKPAAAAGKREGEETGAAEHLGPASSAGRSSRVQGLLRQSSFVGCCPRLPRPACRRALEFKWASIFVRHCSATGCGTRSTSPKSVMSLALAGGAHDSHKNPLTDSPSSSSTVPIAKGERRTRQSRPNSLDRAGRRFPRADRAALFVGPQQSGSRGGSRVQKLRRSDSWRLCGRSGRIARPIFKSRRVKRFAF